MRENIASLRGDDSRYLLLFSGCSLKNLLYLHLSQAYAPQKYLCFSNKREKLLSPLRRLILQPNLLAYFLQPPL